MARYVYLSDVARSEFNIYGKSTKRYIQETIRRVRTVVVVLFLRLSGLHGRSMCECEACGIEWLQYLLEYISIFEYAPGE